MNDRLQKYDLARRIACVLVTLLLPSLAHAHVGMDHTQGFIHGFVHPLTGIDHIAAMVAVGLWAVQRGGRAIWFVPLTFVGVMSLSGFLGVLEIPVPVIETGIAASVFMLGVFLAAAVRLPMVASALIVGLFAVFHGYAHGAEMPETVSGLAYGIGFVMATVLLHCCGIGMGLMAGLLDRPRLVRCAGGATAALGVYLFVT